MGCYCEYSQGEGPDFCDTRMVRARKEHKCCECLEPIKPGEQYERCAGKWGGRMATFHTCGHCAELRKSAGARDPYFEGVAFGQLACWYMGEISRLRTTWTLSVRERSNV